MTVIHLGEQSYIGLTADTKPTNVPNGARFRDTQLLIDYIRTGGAWIELSTRQDYNYLVYPVGAMDFKVKRGTDNQTVYTSSNVSIDALGALEYCRDQVGETSPGGTVELTTGYFPVTSTFTLDGDSHRYIKIKGQGDGSIFGPLSEIRALGDFPAITLNGTTNTALGFGLDGLHLSHDEVSYTTGLVRCLDTAIENTFSNLSFYDGADETGSCFSFEILNTSAIETQYENKILNCNCRGFDNFISVNMQANTATHGSFMSTLDVSNCNIWNTKRVLTVDGVSGGQVLDFHFHRVNFQHDSGNTVSANEGIFDYDSSASCFQHKHSQCMVWDITAAGINYANVGSSVELSTIDCNPTFRIGGSGAYLNKVKSNEYYIGGFGGMNTGWYIPSNQNAEGVGLLSVITTTNPSSPTITQDSTGPLGSWASGTTQGTLTGPRRGPSTFQMQHRPYLEIMASPSSTTLSRCLYGFGTNINTLGDTDTLLGTTDSGIYAGWRPGDTNIQIFHHDGDGSAMTVIDTGLAKTTSLWKCAFMLDATQFQWLVATPSGSKVSAPVSSQVPGSSTNMAISIQAQNTTTTSINNVIRYAKLVLRSL
jgi:hypothetical protein